MKQRRFINHMLRRHDQSTVPMVIRLSSVAKKHKKQLIVFMLALLTFLFMRSFQHNATIDKVITTMKRVITHTTPPLPQPLASNLSTAGSANKLKIVCLGGSSTAGAGNIPKANQYSTLLQANLRATGYSNATVLNHAHGMTNTFYAALHFNSLVPPDADIVIWEYAINDGANPGEYRCRCSIDSMIWFMRQVAQHPNHPALIFVFLWDKGFTLPRPSRTAWNLYRPVLVATNQSIVDVNQWVRDTYYYINASSITKEYFLADTHHMNNYSHSHVASMLQSTVLNPPTGGFKRGKGLLNGWPNDDGNNAWLWGGVLPPVVRTQTLLFDKPSLTLNDDYDINSVKSFRETGKSDRNRIDRMIDLILPLCDRDEFLQMNISASPNERVLRVSVGEGTDVNAVQVQWSRSYFDDNPSNLTLPVKTTFLPAVDPIGPQDYHAFFDRWYEPPSALAGIHNSGNGILWVCGRKPAEVRWVAVLLTSDDP